MRVRCIYPNAVPDNPLVLADTGDMAACGDVIDVDDTLGFRLVDQPEVWAPADAEAWQTVADVLAWANADAPPDPPVEDPPALSAPVLAEAAA